MDRCPRLIGGIFASREGLELEEDHGARSASFFYKPP